MPVCLEPDRSFPVVLDSDMDKPTETRPTFSVRGLSMREQQKLGDALNASMELTTTESIFNATCELLGKYVIGWANMGPHVYPCDMQEFLNHQEARELLRKILHGSYVHPEEKKS